MAFAELLSCARSLSPADQLRLIRELATGLHAAHDPNPSPPEHGYPVWSPHDAYEAAAVLKRLLDEAEGRA